MENLFQNTFLVAQVFGFCAMLCSVVAWQLKNPRHILLVYVPSSLFWSVQYFLLGAYSAAATSLMAACKDLIISYISAQWVKFIIIIFLIFVWCIGLPLAEKPIHLIPLFIITIFNLTLLQPDNRCLMSRVNVLCQIMWLIFNMSVGAWMGVACSIFVACSALSGMNKYEEWEIGRCYRTFLPSLGRALCNFTPRTYS